MTHRRREVKIFHNINRTLVVVGVILLVHSGQLIEAGGAVESDGLTSTSSEYDSPKELSSWRSLQNCSDNNQTGVRVLGGIKAQDLEFMYMAALGYPSDDERSVDFRCGASLITYQFLLTAAHCNTSHGPVMARMGVIKIYNYRPKDPPVDIAIAKVFIHPAFRNRPKVSDIALLKLDRAVDPVTEWFLQPICLYTEPTDPTPGVNLTIVGWGSTDFNSERSEVLLKATVTTWDRHNCTERLARKWFILQDSQLCAMLTSADGKPLADSCQGDSGGPLELIQNKQRYLVGVVSAGWGCGTWNSPGIYTRVAHHIDWIDRVVTQFGSE